MAGRWPGSWRWIAREVGVVVGAWLVAITGLYVVFRAFLGGYRARFGRHVAAHDQVDGTGPPVSDDVWGLLPVEQASVPVQFVDWIWSFATFQFGRSLPGGEPVRRTVVESMYRSGVVVAGVAVVCVVAGIALAVLTRRADASGRGAPLGALAYVLQPALPLVTLMYVRQGARERGLGIRLTETAAHPVTNYGLFALVAVAASVPVLADVLRRVHRNRVADDPGGWRSVIGPGPGGVGGLEAWVYGLYAVTALLVVDDLFLSDGVGTEFWYAVSRVELPLLIGVVAGVLPVAVVAALGRNLLWERATRSRDRPTPDPKHRDAAWTDTAGIAAAIRSERKVRAGVGLLGLGAVVGVLGSALTEYHGRLAVRFVHNLGSFHGRLAVQFVHTLGSLVTVVLVALAVAVTGAVAGLVAARVEETDWQRSWVAHALRIPAEAALLAPVGMATGVGLVAVIAPRHVIADEIPTFGEPAPRAVTELVLGVAAGLVVAGLAFRATYEAGRWRFGADRDRRTAAVESLVAGLSRIDGALVVTVFAVGVWAYLLWGQVATVAPAYQQLFLSHFFDGAHAQQPRAFAAIVGTVLAATAVPVLGVVLLADGLGEATLRAGGGPVPGDGRSAAAGDSPRASVGTTEAADGRPVADDAAVSTDENAGDATAVGRTPGSDVPPDWQRDE